MKTSSLRLHPAILLIILGVLFLILWFLSLRHGFYDHDVQEFVHDFYYRAGFFKVFDLHLLTASKGMNSYYSPVPTVIFNFLFSIFGDRPQPYYLFGLLLHGANAVLVYLVAYLWNRRQSLAISSAFFFFFYPANLQTISWIAAIFIHPLLVFCCLNAAYFFLLSLNKGGYPSYFLSLFWFLAACLTKTSAITLILIFLIWLFYSPDSREKILPFVLIGLVFLMIGVLKYPESSIAREWGGVTLSTFSFLRTLEFLTWLLFPFYNKMDQSLFLIVPVYGFSVCLLIWGDVKSRALIFWCLAVLGMSSFSNFRPLASLSRYLYLASVPFSILVSHILFSTIDKAILSLRHARPA